MPSEVDVLKKLLLPEWDPLGLVGCDGSENHYDPYALRVFEILQGGADGTAIARYLDSVVTSELGLKGNPEIDRAIGAKVIAMRNSS